MLTWHDSDRSWGEHESRADAGPLRLAVWRVRDGYAATMETREGLHSIVPAQSTTTYQTREEAQVAAGMMLERLRDEISAALAGDVEAPCPQRS